MLRPVLLLSTMLGVAAPALAEEADLSEAIVKAPDLTLRDLVPAAILSGMSNPFGLQVEVASNAPDQPFQATFDIMLPDYPNVTISLLVSEREAVTSLISRLRLMAEDGTLPGGSPADREALATVDCFGVVDQNMINCLIGSAGVQFTATDFMGGNAIDYESTKALFATLPLDNFRKAFGQ